MPRKIRTLAPGKSLVGDDGGIVGATPDSEGKLEAPGLFYTTAGGGAIGPLVIEPVEDTVVAFEELQYPQLGRDVDSGGWVNFFGLGSLLLLGAPSTDDDETDPHPVAETDISRRDTLRLVAALGGLGAMGTGAAQSDDTERLTVATGTIAQSEGFAVRLADAVPDALTRNTTYYVVADGVEIDTFAPDNMVSVPGKYTGGFRVQAEAQHGMWPGLRAMWTTKEHTYETTLDSPADQLTEGETVAITSDPAIVQPLKQAGGDNSIATLGRQSIAHTDEQNDPSGEYRIDDGTIVYEVGRTPPAAREFELRIEVSDWDEAMDDSDRF